MKEDEGGVILAEQLSKTNKMIRSFESNFFIFPGLASDLVTMDSITEQSVIEAVTSSKCILLYATLEGVFKQVFKDTVLGNVDINSSKNEEITALIAYDLVNNLLFGLNAIQKRYKSILKIDLRNYGDWESLRNLANMRNLVAHGGAIGYTNLKSNNASRESYNEPFEEIDIYEKWSVDELLEYLIKNKKIESDFKSKPRIDKFRSVISEDIHLLFVRKVQDFFEQLIKEDKLSFNYHVRDTIEMISSLNS